MLRSVINHVYFVTLSYCSQQNSYPVEVVVIIVFCCEVDSMFHLTFSIVNFLLEYSAIVLCRFVNINKYLFCFYLKSQTLSMIS